MKIDLQMKCEHSFIFRCNKLSTYFGYAPYWNKIYYFCENHKDDLDDFNTFSVHSVTKSQIRMIHNSFIECKDKFDADSIDIINGKIK